MEVLCSICSVADALLFFFLSLISPLLCRQMREDPMTYMKDNLVQEKQSLALKIAAMPREMTINTADRLNQVCLCV